MKDFGLRMLGGAFAAIGITLWGVFPMLVLGWLVAAIGRHPAAEGAIKNELVYSLLLYWKGGTESMAPVLIVIIVLVVMMFLSFFLRKGGYSQPHDGLASARPFVKKLLIPSFLGSSAFAIGLLSKETTSGHLWGLFTLIGFGVVFAVVHYIVDVTKRVNLTNKKSD